MAINMRKRMELEKIQALLAIDLNEEMMRNPYMADVGHYVCNRVIDGRDENINKKIREYQGMMADAIGNGDFVQAALLEDAIQVLYTKTEEYAFMLGVADAKSHGYIGNQVREAFQNAGEDEYVRQLQYFCLPEVVSQCQPNAYSAGVLAAETVDLGGLGKNIIGDINNVVGGKMWKEFEAKGLADIAKEVVVNEGPGAFLGKAADVVFETNSQLATRVYVTN